MFRLFYMDIFKRLFKKKPKNSQPGNARIARRILTLARLAEMYNTPLSEDAAAQLARRIKKISNDELNRMVANPVPVIGCVQKIIPLFAGYSEHCAACIYYNHDHKDNKCLLKED